MCDIHRSFCCCVPYPYRPRYVSNHSSELAGSVVGTPFLHLERYMALTLTVPFPIGYCNGVQLFNASAGYIASDGTVYIPSSVSSPFGSVPSGSPGLYQPNSVCEWQITPFLGE